MANLPISVDDFRQQIRSLCPSCKICGFRSHSLIAHIREKHQMSAGQYRKTYADAELASPVAVELLRSLGKNPILVKEKTLADYLPSSAGARPLDQSRIDEWTKSLAWFKTPAGTEEFVPSANKNFKFGKNADMIVMSFATGRNLFVSGPTGCGKTEEIKQVFNRINIPIRRANMHGDVTYGTFIGSMKANATGTYFEYGLLPQAMRAGYPVLLDEIDFTPPNISSVLFPVLERDAELYIPETGEHIKPTKGFCVYATGNTGGKGDGDGSFTGTEVLNTAFLDRFSFKLKADYLSSADEAEMLTKAFPQYSKEFVRRAVAFAAEMRQAFKDGNCSFTWSTRKLLDFMEYVGILGVEVAMDVTLRNWLDKDDEPFVANLYKKVAMDKCPLKN